MIPVMTKKKSKKKKSKQQNAHQYVGNANARKAKNGGKRK
jgi:hypothetical protein